MRFCECGHEKAVHWPDGCPVGDCECKGYVAAPIAPAPETVELFVVQYQWPGEDWKSHWYPPSPRIVANHERGHLRQTLRFDGVPPATRLVKLVGEVVG